MKRFSTPSDSLDLLLGPMCNTFGILVLVACITALLAGQSGSTGADGQRAARTALEERRLAVATRERDSLLAQLQSTGAPTGAQFSAKASEIQRLRDVLKTLQQHASELETHLAQEVRSHAADPGADLHQLNAELHDIKNQQLSLNNTLSALAEQITEGEAAIKHLDGEKGKMVESRTIRMRFPKEHDTSRVPNAVIVRYGRIYPLDLADGTPNPAVKHTSVGPDSTQMDPIASQGWTLAANQNELLRIFDVCKADNGYLSLYAYPDSFQLCRDLRQFAVAHGVEFGLRPVPTSKILVFGSHGSAPPAL